MKKSRYFAVGRATGRRRLLVIVGLARSPIIGPWTLCAVVSAN
jgi:hypothetical protein